MPLMQHRRPTVEIVRGTLEVARQLPEDEQRQAVAALIGLGQHFLAQDELEALLEELMTTSIGQRLLERGFEQGLEQGREQGLEQGREQGLEQGREQGLEQGREQGLEQGREQGLEQAKREDILKILAKQFGPVPPAVSEQLGTVANPARLDALLDAALGRHDP